MGKLKQWYDNLYDQKVLDPDTIPQAHTNADAFFVNHIKDTINGVNGAATSAWSDTGLAKSLIGSADKIQKDNATIKYENLMKRDGVYDYANTHNPITDRRNLKNVSLLTLGGAGLGLGAGHLASLLVNKNKKRTRNILRILGTLGGGALGAFLGSRGIGRIGSEDSYMTADGPGYPYLTSDQMYNPVAAIKSTNISPGVPRLGLSFPNYKTAAYKYAESDLNRIFTMNPELRAHLSISASESPDSNPELFRRGVQLDNIGAKYVNRAANVKENLNDLTKSFADADKQIAKANKNIADYNAVNPLEAITKARNAQFKHWGHLGGGALGGLTGAIGTGLLAKKLFKSDNKKVRLLGALLTGAGGLGGLYLGSRLGGNLLGNIAKTPAGVYQPLTPYTSYNIN